LPRSLKWTANQFAHHNWTASAGSWRFLTLCPVHRIGKFYADSNLDGVHGPARKGVWGGCLTVAGCGGRSLPSNLRQSAPLRSTLTGNAHRFAHRSIGTPAAIHSDATSRAARSASSR